MADGAEVFSQIEKQGNISYPVLVPNLKFVEKKMSQKEFNILIIILKGL